MQSKAARILLLSVLLLTAALAPLAAADQASTKVTVRNKAPTVQDAEGPSEDVVPVPGGTALVPVRIRVSDPNGHADLEVRVEVYREDDDEDERVLHRASVTLTGTPVAGSGQAADFAHSIPMHYHDLPGEYVAVFRVTDKGGSSPQTVEVDFEFEELVALHLVETMLDFGELDAGSDSAVRSTTIRNYGNVELDVRASGTDLAGPQASIPALALRGDGRSLGSQGLLFELGIPVGPGASGKVDWQLATPNVPPGEYRGQLSLAAVESD